MKKLTLALFLCTTFALYAQNGPGGIGKTDGSSPGLTLWLDAADTSTITLISDSVSQWRDKSGKTNHTSSIAGSRPLYQTNKFNELPAIRFGSGGLSTYLQTTNNLPLDNATIFIVYRDTLPTNLTEQLISCGTNTLGFFARLTGGNNNVVGSFSSATGITATFSRPDTSHIFMLRRNGTTQDIWGDGLQKVSTSSGSVATTSSSPLRIGYSSVNTSPFNGWIKEIIIYNYALNEAERALVENYLSAKWNIPLMANDIYSGDNSGYDFNVAGIYLYNRAFNSLNVATSDGLTIRNSTFFYADNDYITFGHQQSGINSVIDVMIDQGNATKCWSRNWSITKNSPDPTSDRLIDIVFDFSDAGMNITPSGTYYLLKSSDGTTWSEVANHSTIQNVDQVFFNNIESSNFPTGTIITIGASSATALPVTLTSFTVTLQNNTPHLQWQTASEVNSKGFNVQRSEISNQNSVWKTIGFVASKNSTSNYTQNYSFIDKSAMSGKNTYRLQQIDNDGKTQYSQEYSITVVPGEYFVSESYPNPFNPTTSINYQIPTNNLVTLKVYNLLGEEIATLVNEEKPAGTYNVNFDGSSLPSGMYFYKLNAGKFSETKKMMLLK